MAFAALKKNSQSTLAKLAEAAKGGSRSYEDTRFWEPTLDKTGSGTALIRFLPDKDPEHPPFVKTYRRQFKGLSGKWYINDCLSTINQDDPVGLYCKQLWDSGSEANKDKARGMKRKLTYVSNILVINDPGNPANNGRVFLFRYGVKIFAKLEDVMSPEFEDEKPMNPFDPFTGASFKLKIRQVEGYRNYDKSEFDSPSELFDGDEDKLEAVEKSLYSIAEFVDAKRFKSFSDLEARFKSVMGDLPVVDSKSAEDLAKSELPAEPRSETAIESRSEISEPAVDSEDDEEAYFQRLARKASA